MADLTVVSTGRHFYRIDDGVAHLLLEMFPEAIKRTECPAPQPVQRKPKFFVRLSPLSDRPQIVLSTLNGESIYPGPDVQGYGDADQAAAAFKKMGFSVPLEVLAEFTAAVEKKLAQNIAAESRAFGNGRG